MSRGVVRVPWLRGLTTTVLPHERRRWAASSSVEDLCRLTAGWLTGRLESQPGYYGPVDVDEAEAPGLTAALLALNAAGLCTRNSQAGDVGPGFDGATWTQHAAVTGYATTQTWIRLLAALEGTGYRMLTHPARRRLHRARLGVEVTRRETQPYTWFGTQLSAADVAFDLDGAGRRAVAAAACGLQVTIWDPTPGANPLWAHLATIPPASAQPRPQLEPAPAVTARPVCHGCDIEAIAVVTTDPGTGDLHLHAANQWLTAWCSFCATDLNEPGWVLPAGPVPGSWAELAAAVLPRTPVHGVGDTLRALGGGNR